MAEYEDKRTPEEHARDREIVRANMAWWEDFYQEKERRGGIFWCWCPTGGHGDGTPHDWCADPCDASPWITREGVLKWVEVK